MNTVLGSASPVSSSWTLVSPDQVRPSLFTRRKFWAERFGIAPVLPTSRAEMDALGWESCDVVLVSGDAYVDHPSFGAALIGRLLEAHGFRVGIIAQPEWTSAKPGVDAVVDPAVDPAVDPFAAL